MNFLIIQILKVFLLGSVVACSSIANECAMESASEEEEEESCEILTDNESLEESCKILTDNKSLEEESCKILTDNESLEEESCKILTNNKLLEEESCEILTNNKSLEEEPWEILTKNKSLYHELKSLKKKFSYPTDIPLTEFKTALEKELFKNQKNTKYNYGMSNKAPKAIITSENINLNEVLVSNFLSEQVTLLCNGLNMLKENIKIFKENIKNLMSHVTDWKNKDVPELVGMKYDSKKTFDTEGSMTANAFRHEVLTLNLSEEENDKYAKIGPEKIEKRSLEFFSLIKSSIKQLEGKLFKPLSQNTSQKKMNRKFADIRADLLLSYYNFMKSYLYFNDSEEEIPELKTIFTSLKNGNPNDLELAVGLRSFTTELLLISLIHNFDKLVRIINNICLYTKKTMDVNSYSKLAVDLLIVNAIIPVKSDFDSANEFLMKNIEIMKSHFLMLLVNHAFIDSQCPLYKALITTTIKPSIKSDTKQLEILAKWKHEDLQKEAPENAKKEE